MQRVLTSRLSQTDTDIRQTDDRRICDDTRNTQRCNVRLKRQLSCIYNSKKPRPSSLSDNSKLADIVVLLVLQTFRLHSKLQQPQRARFTYVNCIKY